MKLHGTGQAQTPQGEPAGVPQGGDHSTGNPNTLRGRSTSPIEGRSGTSTSPHSMPPRRPSPQRLSADAATQASAAVVGASAELALLSITSVTASSTAARKRRHLQLAGDAIADVKTTLYEVPGSLQCANKADWSKGIDVERKRAFAAGQECKKIRESSVGRFSQASEYSKLVWASKGFVCDTLCHAIEDSIARDNPDVTLNRLQFEHMSEYGPYRHAVTVIGELTPELLAKDMKDWPADIVVCDFWSEMEPCPANEYADKFLMKMMDWAERDIGVMTREDRWEDASDPDWLEVTGGRKQAAVRTAADDGSVAYRMLD
ncbi:hypothetical protein [Piscinibacter terrae]|uniref:Uncharacterized protein n=1 Tax=Piscinibacter terrae TaxID=2496871 RepID=A0A3N7HTK4_9BURK|nr:hypothetical protein [Albitalea terrae]RQP24201.1 hypothetical protein DZC73_12850 [Albitalea terrae]